MSPLRRHAAAGGAPPRATRCHPQIRAASREGRGGLHRRRREGECRTPTLRILPILRFFSSKKKILKGLPLRVGQFPALSKLIGYPRHPTWRPSSTTAPPSRGRRSRSAPPPLVRWKRGGGILGECILPVGPVLFSPYSVPGKHRMFLEIVVPAPFARGGNPGAQLFHSSIYPVPPPFSSPGGLVGDHRRNVRPSGGRSLFVWTWSKGAPGGNFTPEYFSSSLNLSCHKACDKAGWSCSPPPSSFLLPHSPSLWGASAPGAAGKLPSRALPRHPSRPERANWDVMGGCRLSVAVLTPRRLSLPPHLPPQRHREPPRLQVA